MKFIADMHIHSRYSRATSKGLNLRTLSEGALKKGIHVLGTGDITHPQWLGEIEAGLQEAEPGLFRLKEGDAGVRFMLTGEISTIYKQGDKVRKVHHVIAAPDLKAARTIATSLAGIGNIISDGRPILGITSRNLLEIVLESSPYSMLIPAHIWTPWFSVLGSKSGFDSIDECYGDLAGYVFAVETGLSSDPAMNRMVGSLDRFHLVSSSDAHSAEKLGREATLFDCDLSYHGLRHALETGEGLEGTIEFFPEEGKYHLDGHRDCGVVLEPEETRERGGVCPKCGKKVTVGVLSRVEELADRHDGTLPPSARPYYSLIPLTEVLSEIMQTGATSKRVVEAYDRLIGKLGGELPLLMDRDIEEIRSVAGDVLALAILRMRNGEVHKEAGYDGNFGRIRVFRDNEADMLFAEGVSSLPKKKPGRKAQAKAAEEPAEKPSPASRLSAEQEEAVAFGEGRLIVRAGPGTGKTRVLAERIRTLEAKGEGPVLGITFTVKAAREIRERLGDVSADVLTFHALAAKILKDCGVSFHIADEDMIADICAGWDSDGTSGRVSDMMFRMSTNAPLEASDEHLLDTLRQEGYFTYEGMIREALSLMSEGRFVPFWRHVLVDEFQDINPLQYDFLKALCPHATSLMVIGDPNQAIYGFRGSTKACFDDFLRDFPGAKTIRLKQTYRLSSHVARAANAFIGGDEVQSSRKGNPLRCVVTPGVAEFIAREIESLSGGLSHQGVARAKGEYGLSDMAVIVRTKRQARPVMEALARASIPFDTAYAQPLATHAGIAERVALLEQRDWQAHVRGVGERSLSKMEVMGRMNPETAQRLARAEELVMGRTGTVMERMEALESSALFKLAELPEDHAFYRYARMFGLDVDSFIRFMRLSHDQGALASERVHVITAHAAKGLEFGCVFITGLSLGSFPLAGEDPAEEENLFYVAMTRAKDLLYLVSHEGPVSPFLLRIPRDVCTEVREKKRSSREQLVLFE